jgi:hypothetical protein
MRRFPSGPVKLNLFAATTVSAGAHWGFTTLELSACASTFDFHYFHCAGKLSTWRGAT